MKKNSTRRIQIILGVFILFTLLTSGCAAPVSDVSVRLKWLHQTQFAGIYVADKEGYYKEENLNVAIEPVDFEQMLSSDKVALGKNTFGVGSADEVLVARSNGVAIKAIAVVYRINPLIYMSLGNGKLNKPEDLIGKKLAISEGQSTYLLNALLSKSGISPSQLEIQKSPTFDPIECLQIAEVCDAYSTSGLVSTELKGMESSALWPSDYGVPFYADVIFTSNDMIIQQPEVVERFLRATLRGWQSAIENTEKATDITMTYAPDMDRDFQLGMLKASVPLIDTGILPIGVMEPDMWQQMYDILFEQGVIVVPFDLSTAYTNEFMDKIAK